MPKRRTSARARNAVASRAAYMSPEASPAEIRTSVGGIRVAIDIFLARDHADSRRAGARPAGIVASCARRDRHGYAQLLVLVLELVEAVVNAALGEQFLMGALFAQTALCGRPESDRRAGSCSGGARLRWRCGRSAAGRAPRES